MERIDLICFKCIHFGKPLGGCKAFSNGIPNEILINNMHDRPIDGQNSNIVFEAANTIEFDKLSEKPKSNV